MIDENYRFAHVYRNAEFRFYSFIKMGQKFNFECSQNIGYTQNAQIKPIISNVIGLVSGPVTLIKYCMMINNLVEFC